MLLKFGLAAIFVGSVIGFARPGTKTTDLLEATCQVASARYEIAGIRILVKECTKQDPGAVVASDLKEIFPQQDNLRDQNFIEQTSLLYQTALLAKLHSKKLRIAGNPCSWNHDEICEIIAFNLVD